MDPYFSKKNEKNELFLETEPKWIFGSKMVTNVSEIL